MRALSYALSTFTAIFNSFFFAVCVIFAETLDLLVVQNQLRDFYQGWIKLHISYLIDFELPKGTPLMFNVDSYQFSAQSSLPCNCDRNLAKINA